MVDHQKSTYESLGNIHHLHHLLCHPKHTDLCLNKKSTFPKTNIASENRPSKKQSHLPTIDFQG